MNELVIEGGWPLKGKVSLFGAKNSSFKLMIAALLSDQPSMIDNVPQIGDVRTTIRIIRQLRGVVKKTGSHSFMVNGAKLKRFQIQQNWGANSRSAWMFVAPLLARFGQAWLPCPGGDQIGCRPLERHFEGLKALGAKIDFKNDFFRIQTKQIKGNLYRFAKNSHTGTEILIMAAVLAQGKTVLENAAQEPEVDDLIVFLNKMGAKIKRKNARLIEIIGVKKLRGGFHRVMVDRNEAVTFACAALATKGNVLVKNAQSQHLTAFLNKLEEIGAGVEKGKQGIRFFYHQPFKASQVVTAPHPGFMTDWQPLWTVLMTQAKGCSVVQEAVFERRFDYVSSLKKMGAKIEFFNPRITNPESFYNFNLKDDVGKNLHAIRIFGSTILKGKQIAVPDIRAGATLLLAALVGRGKTRLTGIEQLDRGYENLDARLVKLGARIKRKS